MGRESAGSQAPVCSRVAGAVSGGRPGAPQARAVPPRWRRGGQHRPPRAAGGQVPPRADRRPARGPHRRGLYPRLPRGGRR
eukprot:5534272-Lingulodinium_polyedra.AAC.1